MEYVFTSFLLVLNFSVMVLFEKTPPENEFFNDETRNLSCITIKTLNDLVGVFNTLGDGSVTSQSSLETLIIRHDGLTVNWNNTQQPESLTVMEQSTSMILDNICLIHRFIAMVTTRTIILLDESLHSGLLTGFAKCKHYAQEYRVVVLNQYSDAEKTKKILLLQKTTGVQNFILLGGSFQFTSNVLQVAIVVGLLLDKYTWILPHGYLSPCYTEHLPMKLLSLESLQQHAGKENAVFISHGEQHIIQPQGRDTVVFTVQIPDKKDKTWTSVAFIKHTNVFIVSESLTLLQNFKDSNICRRIRVVTIIDPPFTTISNVVNKFDNTCAIGRLCWKYEGDRQIPYCCIGISMDLLTLIERDLDQCSDLYIVEDSTYGATVNGTWVGMVGDLVHGKADMVAAALTVNEKRSKVISFTEPYINAGIALITLPTKSNLDFFNMECFKPLSSMLWLATTLLVMITSFLLLFTERRHRTCYTIKQSLMYISGLTFQRNIGGEEPIGFGSRVIALTVAMAMMVIMSTYTAVLTAQKVTHTAVLPIGGFKDDKMTNPSTSFTYGTIANSAYTDMFRDSTDPVWNRMYQFMKDYNFRNTTKAIEMLLDGSLNAIISDYIVLHHFVSRHSDCSIKFAGELIPDAGQAFAVRKGHPLSDEISRLIRNYQREQIIRTLINRWTSSDCTNSASSSSSSSGSSRDNSAQEISLHYFGNLFVIIVASSFLSAIVAMLEIQFWRRLERRKKTIST